jgi:hypothetical protein
MKKLRNTKNICKETQLFIKLINKYCHEINKEYLKKMHKLIKNIAKGENLDIHMLKEKYLKTLDKNSKENHQNNDINNEDDNIHEDIHEDIHNDSPTMELNTETYIETNKDNILEEIIFDKIIIDDINYYYENKEDGRIYNSSSNIVGFYKNKKFIFN